MPASTRFASLNGLRNPMPYTAVLGELSEGERNLFPCEVLCKATSSFESGETVCMKRQYFNPTSPPVGVGRVENSTQCPTLAILLASKTVRITLQAQCTVLAILIVGKTARITFQTQWIRCISDTARKQDSSCHVPCISDTDRRQDSSYHVSNTMNSLY